MFEVEVQASVVTLLIMTYLFVVRVADNQKGIVWPRQDIFTCVVPGYSVDLQRDKNFYDWVQDVRYIVTATIVL